MQVLAFDRAAEVTGVDEQVEVFAAQAAQLPAAQSEPGKAQDDQPVARRAAGAQQPQDLLVGGVVDRLVRLAEAMARAGPVAQLVALSTNLGRQVPVVADPVELAEHLRWHGPDIHAMAKELSDYGKDKVHPPLAAHWPRPWASVDWPVGVGRGVLKPGHERSKPLS